MLRTFDDLNYRQEQRFHLELGLLKLIHAQRLLPMEELLSGVAAGAGFALASCLSAARPTARAARAARRAARLLRAVGRASLAVWPGGRRSGLGREDGFRAHAGFSEPVATMERAAPPRSASHAASSFQGVTPFPAATPQAHRLCIGETLTEGALAKAPQAAAAPHQPAQH